MLHDSCLVSVNDRVIRGTILIEADDISLTERRGNTRSQKHIVSYLYLYSCILQNNELMCILFSFFC